MPWLLLLGLCMQAADTEFLVKVNGKAFGSKDLHALAAAQEIFGELTPEIEAQLTEMLVERALLRSVLAKRKLAIHPDELKLAQIKIENALKQRGETAEQYFSKRGFTKEQLIQELSFPLLWQSYVRQAITVDQIQQYFRQHQQELDGTKIKVRHLILKSKAKAEPADLENLREKATKLRQDILAQRMTFEEAAKKHSQSPTAERGGDLGWITPFGKLPPEVSAAAFATAKGEITAPVTSVYGVHLIQVVDIQPGKLTFEDARPLIVKRLAADLWKELVAQQRRTAKIELPSQDDSR